tara:strand:- start:538 stop:726 length:189 start_codon:yes stop_codon:yes gene_type:complete
MEKEVILKPVQGEDIKICVNCRDIRIYVLGSPESVIVMSVDEIDCFIEEVNRAKEIANLCAF